MSKLYFLLSVLIMSTSLLMGQDASAIVQFETESIHLGKVSKGKKVKEVFTFKNVSAQNVEIDIVSTCECTEAKWTRGPIAPGETGTINFVFDSSQKDEEVPIDVDVYFLNVDPKNGNPYSTFLQYTYEFAN